MVLIDCTPLKSGGGCQLALNFITQLSRQKDVQNYIILVPDIGPLSSISNSFLVLKFITSPSSKMISRFIFEYFTLKKVCEKYKVKKIYTFFGAGLPAPKKVITIVSIAYPIICYPDSSFWTYLPKKKKIKQKIINKLRIARLKKANYLISETSVMQKRLAKALNREQDTIKVLSPSPSEFVQEKAYEKPKDKKTVFLVLSGLAPHKNLWRLNEMVKYLKEEGKSFKFILTVNKKHYLELDHTEELQEEEINKYFEFVGTVPPNEIDFFYKKCHFLLNLSDLESYSNNYMEAWKTGTPLIVSNRDFAKGICRDSAIYIEPHDLKVSMEGIIDLMNNTNKQEQLVLNGKERLKELPTQTEKMNIILQTIKEA